MPPLLRPLTVLMAALMASPALWAGFVTGKLDVRSAMIRFLVAVPVAMLMLAGMRALTASYRRAQNPKPAPAPAPAPLVEQQEPDTPS